MKHSPCLDVVWQLAAQEAVVGRFKEIEPEHFLEAILKFSETSIEEVRKALPDNETTKDLEGEIKEIQSELKSRQIDSTRARRELRAWMGNGEGRPDGDLIHRSKGSRDLIDSASAFARSRGCDEVKAVHVLQSILSSPTAAMLKVLGVAVGEEKQNPLRTPLLDRHARDLRKYLHGKPPPPNPDATSAALSRILSQERCSNVFLVGKNSRDAISAMEGAAALNSGGRRRVYDLMKVEPKDEDLPKYRKLYGSLLEEAQRTKGIAVLIPFVLPGFEIHHQDEWHESLKGVLGAGAILCVVYVTPTILEQSILPNPSWKRLGKVMWIHETENKSIPFEL